MHNIKFKKASFVSPFNENVLEIFLASKKIALIGEIDLSVTDKLIKNKLLDLKFILKKYH